MKKIYHMSDCDRIIVQKTLKTGDGDITGGLHKIFVDDSNIEVFVTRPIPREVIFWGKEQGTSKSYWL